MCHASVALVLLSQSPGTIISAQSAPKREGANRGWRAATYRGLTVGESTRADMLRILGEPFSSVCAADQDDPRLTTLNDYESVTGDLPGGLAVEVSSRINRIVSISLSPAGMSEEGAVKYFGDDHRRVSYPLCGGSG